jgi:type I restriction enzyme S subunit
MDYVDDFLFHGRFVLLGEDGSVINDEGFPILQFEDGKFWVNNHAHVLEGKDVFTTNYLYLLLRKTNVSHIVTGAVQLKINQGNLNRIPVNIGDKNTYNKFNQIIDPMFNQYFLNNSEKKSLTQLRDTLLPKLMSGEIEIQ